MAKGMIIVEITYDYYRIFYYVAQHQNFTKAAEALNNNQPNITRCMNNLEHALGCKLFVRTNHGVTLTPEGKQLYTRVAIAFEQLLLGEEEIQKDCSLDVGTVSIGASETALHLLLLDRLSIFHEKYPGVHLRITNHSTFQSIAALTRGEIDCAVVSTPFTVKKPLQVTPLLSFREILICGPHFRYLAGEQLRLQDVEQYPFVCLGRGTSTYEFYQRLFFKHDLTFHVDMEAATMDQVLPMVQHNLGIGFFSETLATPAIARGEIYQIHLAEPVPARSISLIEDTAHPQSIAMKTLRKLLCADPANQ